MEKQSAGHWWRTLRPLFWWVLIVLVLYGIRTHQRLMENTRLGFSVAMQGQPLYDAVTTLDGQLVTAGQKISLGSHVFSVSHPKGEAFGTNLFVWYGRNDLGAIILKRSQGTLNVLSQPLAGTITITGPEFSTTLNDLARTNLTVPTDAYEIRADYPHWTESKNVVVRDRQTGICAFTPQFVTVHLTCNRDGATYRLQFANGQNADSGNLPASVAGLPPGSYQMTGSYHHRQIQKTVVLTAGATNEVPLEFLLGAARIETVPTGADVQTVDGRILGQTPLDLPDLTPPTAQFNLSLRGYEPVSVLLTIIADQTSTLHTNLLSVRFSQALREARQYRDVGNWAGVATAANEVLALKPDESEAQDLLTTATDRLEKARQRSAVEQQQAESARQSSERLKQPRLVFDALCGQNSDAALFAEHDIKTIQPAKEAEAAIVKALQASPLGYQISADELKQPGVYQVTAKETFSLGFLGGTERVCLLVVGQTKDDETQILFKVVEYKIQHTLVDLKDQKQLIPIHPSRMQMDELDQAHVKTGIRMVTERIQKALEEVQ